MTKIYELKKKLYIYKRKPDGSLVTHWSRLANPEEGSAINTYRKLQKEKAHLPLALWSGGHMI